MIKNMKVSNTLQQIQYSNQSLQNLQISIFLSRVFLQYKVASYKCQGLEIPRKKKGTISHVRNVIVICKICLICFYLQLNFASNFSEQNLCIQGVIKLKPNLLTIFSCLLQLFLSNIIKKKQVIFNVPRNKLECNNRNWMAIHDNISDKKGAMQMER